MDARHVWIVICGVWTLVWLQLAVFSVILFPLFWAVSWLASLLAIPAVMSLASDKPLPQVWLDQGQSAWGGGQSA